MIDWVIVGGESQRGARPIHPAWVRDIRDQCQRSGVPFFFKQWGRWMPWEQRGQAPFWRNPDGIRADGHELIPENVAESDDWRQGLMVAPEHDGAAVLFEKVGKDDAGHALDGEEYREFPERTRLQESADESTSQD